jgi:hypothetical protein
MNNFTPKYMQMASQYLQERIDSLEKKNEVKMLPLQKKESIFKNMIKWIVKN